MNGICLKSLFFQLKSLFFEQKLLFDCKSLFDRMSSSIPFLVLEASEGFDSKRPAEESQGGGHPFNGESVYLTFIYSVTRWNFFQVSRWPVLDKSHNQLAASDSSRHRLYWGPNLAMLYGMGCTSNRCHQHCVSPRLRRLLPFLLSCFFSRIVLFSPLEGASVFLFWIPYGIVRLRGALFGAARALFSLEVGIKRVRRFVNFTSFFLTVKMPNSV